MLLKDLIPLIFEEKGIPEEVYFRVDAGRLKGLSFGHLSRCHVLSHALKKNWSIKTFFIMHNYPDGINHAKALGETVLSISDSGTDWLKAVSGSLAFDLPQGPSSDELSIAKEKGIWTVVLDDINNKMSWANVILNSSIIVDPSVYPENTRLLLGPDFFIFDQSLMDIAPVRKESMFNVVLTFGGSDPTDLTKKVIKTLLGEQWPGVFFRTILGPGYVDPGSVKNLLVEQEQNFEVEVNPVNIVPFFQGCDFAVCAGGRTMYELLYLNKRFLPIATAKHEAEAIAEFLNQGLVDYGMTAWKQEDFLMRIKKIVRPLYSEKNIVKHI